MSVGNTTSSARNPPLRWWLASNGKTSGPHAEAYVIAGLKAGQISATILACPEHATIWQPVAAWPQFAGALYQPAAPTPPPLPAAALPPPPPPLPNHAADAFPDGLTSERLPEAAEWICNYCLFGAPLLWLLYNAMCVAGGSSFHEESDFFGLEVVIELLNAPCSLALVVLLIVGGWQLKHRRVSGPTMIKIGLVLYLVLGAISLLLKILLVAAASASPVDEFAPDGQWGGIGLLLFWLLVSLVDTAFEIFALVWLIRNQKQLPLKSVA